MPFSSLKVWGARNMEFLLVIGMVVCGWVFLCVLCGERERREEQIEREARERAAKEAEEARIRAALALHAAGGQSEKLTGIARPTRVA
jgi:hypothetical protein